MMIAPPTGSLKKLDLRRNTNKIFISKLVYYALFA